MTHNHLIVLFSMLLVWNFPQHGYAQQERTAIPLSGKSDSCNVVNLQCGAAPSGPNHETPNRMPGAPGKAGPVGPIGPHGMKGEKGNKGGKGDKGLEVNVTDILLKVNDMLGASNCTQLRDQGITKSGCYQLRSPESVSAVFTYCDFEIYDGVTTCDELRRRIKVKSVGRYFLRPDESSEAREVVCSADVGSTCSELSLKGVLLSGTNILKHANSNETFAAHCSEVDDRVITEIWHAQMGEIQNPTDTSCSGKGCYSWTPQYEISRDHILGVIAKSSECRQFIKARCVETHLLRNSYAWWVSRDGEKMSYWGGATSRRDGYCACGETGSCIDNSYKCNCDTNRGTEGTDEGYLTDKTKLPVQELRFGDLDQSSEFVWHTLGKLECWGQA